jgi:hypothetical protein
MARHADCVAPSVPFLPFVLVLAGQALSRSASFALGWATALYFGQVPGRQGRLLSVMSLLAAGWVIVAVGFAVPLLAGAALAGAGIVERNFEVQSLVAGALVAAVVAVPPVIAALSVWAELPEERSIGAWMRLLPHCYPATGSLGLAVLEMVVFTPFLLFERWRRHRVVLQLPLVFHDRASAGDLPEALSAALATAGIDRLEITEARGPRSWPLRTVAYASRHLLGAVVRGDPIQARAGRLEILAYATNVAIVGPKVDAYLARAVLQRGLAFRGVYLTWGEDSQRLEERLMELHRRAGKLSWERLTAELDVLQRRIDETSLTSEEWNVLYRLRLQLEVHAREAIASDPAPALSPDPEQAVLR